MRLASALALAACGALCAVIVPPTAAQESPPSEARVGRSPSGDEIFFDGPIDARAVARFEEELRRAPARALWIRSTGGEADAGLRFGEQVRDARLEVVVIGCCLSSCANYVFTAAARRRLEGVVAWHGSVEQKDLREWQQCGRTVSSLFGTPMPQRSAAQEAEALASLKLERGRQSEFFASIGVDEYLTRAGQEPAPGDGRPVPRNFTYDVPTMARFGLRDVTAAPDYGSPAWCDRLFGSSAGVRLACIEVSDDMLAYEGARRQQGEVCQPDGTLRVRR